MAYYDGELIKENFAERLNEVDGIILKIDDAAVLLGLAISDTPTADVEEVKHGKWEVNVGMNYNRERICPICKEKIESNHWNYCPYCGAIMDGKEKERNVDKLMGS